MLKYITDLFFDWLKRRRKKAILKVINEGKPVKLVIKTLNEYDLNIYCQKRTYRRETDRWFYPKHSTSYLVFAIPTGNVPLDILEVCSSPSLEVIAIRPDFLWDEIQMKLAAKEYIELLTQRLHEYHNVKKQ